ncbi:hypothetical protein GW7_09510 [Heterocephalus glaber]|uniref:Uncharacterized protein n=1 Tax=Heterocephalus glaber TaxID=10181 RepID=G5B5Z2_HETGA|nr:hypothetical protein GW7_09510 [Heterocephalus glaber]
MACALSTKANGQQGLLGFSVASGRWRLREAGGEVRCVGEWKLWTRETRSPAEMWAILPREAGMLWNKEPVRLCAPMLVTSGYAISPAVLISPDK